MKTAAMGLGGLLASERNLAAQQVNHGCALADPRDEIRITGLEVFPVNSMRTIFVKMNTDVGIAGIGEGTVEGRIPYSHSRRRHQRNRAVPHWQ
jgi:galactonate dehydratase